MKAIITAHELTKHFGATKALDHVSYEVQEGEIFGLIGADGAGKTTAFRIMAGVLAQTSGDIEILGQKPRASRSSVGYLTQPFSLYLDLSVMENLHYAAGLREVPEADFKTRAERYLRLFDMDRFTDRLAGRLSGGMKQKLALSSALIAGPRILLLDEPTTGVDPVSRRDFWDALSSLAEQGITIVVATPYLDEAERCHRIALMERGKIHEINTPAGFRTEMGLARIEVHARDLQRAEQSLRGLEGVSDVQRFGDRLDVMSPDPDRVEAEIRNRVEVSSLRRSQPTLENAVVSTLRKMRPPEHSPEFPQASPKLGDGSVAIGAYGLDKRFGSFQAVKQFNLEIRFGEIYGLLGANGAGKTTAIKMICGLLDPTAGSVALLGRKTGLRSAAVRSRIGYMSQKFTLYDDLTIGENLDFYSRLYGIREALRQERKRWVLDAAELAGEEKMITGSLPGGWKQRVAFGAAVMHEPGVVFLDEPTSGVDPLARRAMWRMINKMADRGAAILVVTHYLEEAEQCNRIGFMAAGEIIADGSPSEVRQRLHGSLLEVMPRDPKRAVGILKEQFGAQRVSLFGDRLHVVVDSAESGADKIRKVLGEPTQVEPVDPSLEDVFISLIEERRQSIPQ